MEHKSTDPLLSEKELSAWLGISLPSLQRLRSHGTGPRFVRLSERRIAYRRADVEAWLVSRTRERIDDGSGTSANPGNIDATRQMHSSGL